MLAQPVATMRKARVCKLTLSRRRVEPRLFHIEAICSRAICRSSFGTFWPCCPSSHHVQRMSHSSSFLSYSMACHKMEYHTIYQAGFAVVTGNKRAILCFLYLVDVCVIQTCTCTPTHAYGPYAHIRIHTCTHTHTQTYIRTLFLALKSPLSQHAYAHIHIHTCTHTHTHIHIHTHTCICIHAFTFCSFVPESCRSVHTHNFFFVSRS
jgi:hypothetical protein